MTSLPSEHHAPDGDVTTLRLLPQTRSVAPRLTVWGAGGDTPYTFNSMRQGLAERLLESEPIHRGTWQTLDVAESSLHATRELRNVSLFYTVPAMVPNLQQDVKPDLPWADEHHEERVGGEPLNPAPSYLRWPHHAGSSARHTEQAPREIDERDWAYLAALIDGDGSISYVKRRASDQGRPRIHVSQRDHDFIRALYDRYGFGKISFSRDRNTRTPDGAIRRSTPGTWSITSKSLVGYVLEHIIPYLMLKRDIAERALKDIRSMPAHHADKPMEMEDAKFSHTYPERFWPRYAGNATTPNRGIRYEYGDLDGVVNQLVKNPFTRQAVLPVWAFEDTGATDRRVPCSLSYHFMADGDNRLSVWYALRACDFVRHFHNDVYFACRLLQWVIDQTNIRTAVRDRVGFIPGELNMTISSLHAFMGDEQRLIAIAEGRA